MSDSRRTELNGGLIVISRDGTGQTTAISATIGPKPSASVVTPSNPPVYVNVKTSSASSSGETTTTKHIITESPKILAFGDWVANNADTIYDNGWTYLDVIWYDISGLCHYYDPLSVEHPFTLPQVFTEGRIDTGNTTNNANLRFTFSKSGLVLSESDILVSIMEGSNTYYTLATEIPSLETDTEVSYTVPVPSAIFTFVGIRFYTANINLLRIEMDKPLPPED